MREWQLKLADGHVVVWTGTDGEDAARRYVATFPTAIVVAIRNHPRVGIFQGGRGMRLID